VVSWEGSAAWRDSWQWSADACPYRTSCSVCQYSKGYQLPDKFVAGHHTMPSLACNKRSVRSCDLLRDVQGYHSVPLQ
jgi:hypothetical protein